MIQLNHHIKGKSGTTNLATTGGANTVTVAVTNNQAATNATNQSVTITGSIANTSLTTAQLASHAHSLKERTGFVDSAQPPVLKTGTSAPTGIGNDRSSGQTPVFEGFPVTIRGCKRICSRRCNRPS